MTTAIFLGAGASAAEGAPMQSELFHKYFAGAKQGPEAMKMGLAKFFRLMFSIDVAAPQNDVDFPTFEEALGILDLAELRRESLRDLSLDAAASDNIRTTHHYLVFAMALVIAEELSGQIPRLHQKVVTNLHAEGHLSDTIFISTNYDILIDNALLNRQVEEISGSFIDYGVEFTNFDVPDGIQDQWRRWNRPKPSATKLYKLHGSLNWLFCPTCNSLTLTPGMKGAIRLLGIDDPAAKCQVCLSLMAPIIVPPTFYKDMSRIFLSMIWNKAESALRKADHLILCGYSFPDADMHIKYLLKRIQTNRNPQDLRVTVISNHPSKTDEQRNEEKLRYQRFLGRDVKYTDSSFEDFANNPATFFN
jgi:NAD-dependent SIR2 family protein deacetylase